MDVLESASIIELSDEKWVSLENTDSHLDNVRLGHIEDAEKINEIKNSRVPLENRHGFKKVLDGFLNGSKMEVPAILRDENGRLHLVSGDTRLTICRALGVRPKVIIGELR